MMNTKNGKVENSLPEITNFNVLGDNRGNLVAIEQNKDVPFDIRRVFYVYGTSDEPRGFHAHHLTKQALICLQGSVTIELDNGTDKREYLLDSKDKMLIQDKMVWGVNKNFSKDCILLVLSNMSYVKEDYITDYEKFKSITAH